MVGTSIVVGFVGFGVVSSDFGQCEETFMKKGGGSPPR